MPRYNPHFTKVHVAIPECRDLERASFSTIEDLLVSAGSGSAQSRTTLNPRFLKARWDGLGEVLRLVYPRLTPEKLKPVMWHRFWMSFASGKGWPEPTKEEADKFERTMEECGRSEV